MVYYLTASDSQFFLYVFVFLKENNESIIHFKGEVTCAAYGTGQYIATLTSTYNIRITTESIIMKQKT